jgi:ABC-type branched-subunit amino acid transport system ATPase component
VTERLRVDNLQLAFGHLVVAANISLMLEVGARSALIGPNGAGKTTLVDMISGSLKPHSGGIFLDGAPITGLSDAARARRGIVRTYQISRLFKDLTVAENVRVAILQRSHRSMRLWESRAIAAADADEIADILQTLGLGAVAERSPCGRGCCCWTSRRPACRRPRCP